MAVTLTQASDSISRVEEVFLEAVLQAASFDAGFGIKQIQGTRDKFSMWEMTTGTDIVQAYAAAPSDAGTAAMRTNDHARKELAFKTGAQIISTDYIVPDKRFRSAYMVHFPNQKLERINPVFSEGMKESGSN